MIVFRVLSRQIVEASLALHEGKEVLFPGQTNSFLLNDISLPGLWWRKKRALSSLHTNRGPEKGRFLSGSNFFPL
jgi:hypothetical protein